MLLSFGGETLLARHIRLLRGLGIERIDLAVGHRAEEVEQAIARIGAQDYRGRLTSTRISAEARSFRFGP